MRTLAGILRKELIIYFTTPIAYVVMALFTAIASIFFWTFLSRFMADSQTFLQVGRPELLDQLNFNDRVLTPLYVGYVQMIFLFVLPLLTMRLVAEERRTHTMELLLSTPVQPWQIVLGKYLAALTLVLVLCSICLVYPLLLQLFGRGVGEAGPLDWGSVWLGWLGLVLVGATCAAVGLFTSSVTESQIVAAVLGMMLLLFFWVLRGVGAGLDGATGAALHQVSLLTHIESYARGAVLGPGPCLFCQLHLPVPLSLPSLRRGTAVELMRERPSMEGRAALPGPG
ncbi:MAG: ABC transporter permease [Pseudomonadota bacterium]